MVPGTTRPNSRRYFVEQPHLNARPSPPQSPPETIACPKCDEQITSTIYAHDSGIPILKCPACSGVCLVQGQLEKIRQYRNGPHKTDRLGQAMAESYRQTNALNKIADLIQSRVLSTVFRAGHAGCCDNPRRWHAGNIAFGCILGTSNGLH